MPVNYRDYADPECAGSTTIVFMSDSFHLWLRLVPAYAAGWRVASFPLSSANDDATAPIPVTGLISPALVTDAIPSAAPLILYLALGQPGDTSIADVLYATKQAGGVEIRF